MQLSQAESMIRSLQEEIERLDNENQSFAYSIDQKNQQIMIL